MNSKLTQNQDLLLNILKISLYKYPKNINPQDAKNIGLFYKNLLKDSSVYKKLINADWNQLISSADKHGVLSVMYEVKFHRLTAFVIIIKLLITLPFI